MYNGFINADLILRCLGYERGLSDLKQFRLSVSSPDDVTRTFQDDMQCIEYLISDIRDNVVIGNIIIIDEQRFYFCRHTVNLNLKFNILDNVYIELDRKRLAAMIQSSFDWTQQKKKK